MTDRPERPQTIVPPPDREKTTDPPLPTDRAPPEDLLLLAENVFERIGAIEDTQRRVECIIVEKFAKLDEIHALLFGTPSKPDGRPMKNIVSALHELSGTVAVAGANAELVAELQKSLPQRLAPELANKLLGLFQGELHAQDARIKVLEARVDALTVAGPNGPGNPRLEK